VNQQLLSTYLHARDATIIYCASYHFKTALTMYQSEVKPYQYIAYPDILHLATLMADIGCVVNLNGTQMKRQHILMFNLHFILNNVS